MKYDPRSRGLRVAILGPHYGDYTVQLALALSKEHRVGVFAATHALSNEVTPAWLGVLSRSVDLYRYKGGSEAEGLLSLPKLAMKIARFRPDVVIAPEMGHRYHTLLILLLARFVPVHLIIHDPEPHAGEDALHRARIASRIHAERNAASSFLVHGDFCAERLRAVYSVGSRAVTSFAHGPIIRPASAAGAGAAAPRSRDAARGGVLMFGRMQGYKGLGILLEAMRLLREEGNQIPLTLAGRGPELQRLGDEFLGLGNVEIVSRYITAEETSEMFSRAGIVVLPYLEATQSGVVPAAFANGVPIVASAVGGVPEVVRHGENGFLVPPRDPHALADAIRNLAQDPALKARLAEGARVSADVHSWSEAARAINSALQL